MAEGPAFPQTHYYLSCSRFTCQVDVRDHDQRVMWAAPIARRFTAQHFSKLIDWAGTFGQVTVEKL